MALNVTPANMYVRCENTCVVSWGRIHRLAEYKGVADIVQKQKAYLQDMPQVADLFFFFGNVLRKVQ